MFDWLTRWSKDNPKDIYGPGILIGVVGGAVVVATTLVMLGQPFATDSMQTGPRGTGMSIPEFKADLAKPYPDIARFAATTSAPVVPAAGAQRAGDAYPDAEPLLADLTVENYDRLIAAMQAWTGIPDLLAGEETYQTLVARRMIVMTREINETWSGHVNAQAEVGVTCYTCHRGEPVPSGTWFKTGAVNEAAAGWAANQNRVTPVSQFTSLPSDALEKYLLDGETIKVHDLESRVANQPGDPLIQHAERTYSLMNYISNSLGVNCLLCHSSRAFYDPGQVTPQWSTATLGIQMVQELNNTYLVPLAELLPPERLGPVAGDAPKVACMTCHKGQQKPLQGTNVIGDWPELATTSGTPVYN
ncbi:MAG: photosynthetic reaction center cytochrome c subunit [Alphaproteobacteria bacterium HGW-Alphaproteobacteria-2]|nr:MAG: photosynthetic reaction center cytochrome c subunit [Alphaproteobacteria bacterium HGW-Alphaproteobacteria-2]